MHLLPESFRVLDRRGFRRHGESTDRRLGWKKSAWGSEPDPHEASRQPHRATQGEDRWKASPPVGRAVTRAGW